VVFVRACLRKLSLKWNFSRRRERSADRDGRNLTVTVQLLLTTRRNFVSHTSTHQAPRGRTGTHNHADERAQEAQFDDVPAAFHLERLHAHASDDETWRVVDAVTFETFPLAREVRAIRRAVTALDGRARPGGAQAVGGSASSTVGANFPKTVLRAAGGLEAKDVLAAYL
jgi:S-methylmethionine-dependent homocysteine/selenocysteine methylase